MIYYFLGLIVTFFLSRVVAKHFVKDYINNWETVSGRFVVSILWPISLPFIIISFIISHVIYWSDKNEPPTWL